jgi:glyoxylase-like metal-dependent hydrolase (beta-lactamase superfamily II)
MVGAPLHAIRAPGARPLVDGDAVCSGAACLRVVATPGHSADHVAFFLEEDRALFTGDAVVGRGTSFIDPPDGDLALYLNSLERMAALGARTIYPGHGPVVLDAAGTLRWYREHRLERERQILELLGAEGAEEAEGGPDHAVDDLVAEIYVGYPPDVLPLAARSVTAHLLKLEAEGRVRRHGHGIAQRWALAAPKACARCGRTMTGAGRYCQRCLVTMLQGAGTAEASGTDQP